VGRHTGRDGEPVTGVGLCVPQLGEGLTLDLLREFCRRAETTGYTSLWVQDHFLWPLEPRRGYAGRVGRPIPPQYRSVLSPTELLTAVALWTGDVRIGTSILVAGNHWPAPLAQRLATIDMLSAGRLSVGLGIGWSAEEHEAAGTDVATRGARMEDFVPALLACWGDDPVSHDGPFFSIPPTLVRPKPVQRPRPPLLSGMWSPAGLERTRVHFDGWNPAGLPVVRVKDIVEDLNGRRPGGMEPLTVHYRTFAQFPNAPAADGDVVERLAAEAAEARDAGFDDVILEHNFWSGVEDPAAWLDVPEQFAPVVAAARR
jgi:probable F420-dependent oxidoreductase